MYININWFNAKLGIKNRKLRVVLRPLSWCNSGIIGCSDRDKSSLVRTLRGVDSDEGKIIPEFVDEGCDWCDRDHLLNCNRFCATQY